ncbi:uncharacterized protein LOC143232792 isoform X4 [Tachypleus tridentatus]|uniref:uncharacterized protein LOC143232792 isoform X4 n=1 Tax=Tachypleus tridentatus TaxID=6853 RepID=UPI003FCFB508
MTSRLFKCGEDGHMSRDCPNVGGDMRSKSGCFKYGEDGHVSRAIKNPDKQVGHDGTSKARIFSSVINSKEKETLLQGLQLLLLV